MRRHGGSPLILSLACTLLVMAALASIPLLALSSAQPASATASPTPARVATIEARATAPAAPLLTSPTARATPPATAAPAPSPTATRRPVLSRAIFVDQDAQVVHIFENDVEIKTFPCSTGMPGRRTPAWTGRVGHYVGTFRSFGTYADNAWYLFDATSDILIHSAPYTWRDGQKVYQGLDDLGRKPASHGCIRLRPEDARWLTEWRPEGVPIAISPLTEASP